MYYTVMYKKEKVKDMKFHERHENTRTVAQERKIKMYIYTKFNNKNIRCFNAEWNYGTIVLLQRLPIFMTLVTGSI